MDNKVEVKITLLGDPGVGKTCIINRFTEDKFIQKGSTKGAQYSNKNLKIRNNLVKMDIWDTAGQEQYRALGRNFYRDSFIVLLVYDITNKNSFENLEKIWYPDLKEYGEEYKVLAVVGTKSDLYENEEVLEEEARNYAKEKDAIFMLVSAKNGNNINVLFNELAEKYLEKTFKKVEEMENIKEDPSKMKLNNNLKRKGSFFKSKKCC